MVCFTIRVIYPLHHSVSVNRQNDRYLNHLVKHYSNTSVYDCISGKNFVLNDADFPEFSQAIEYSIANPNGWCYKRLQEKSREFDKDHPNELETYLRITVGENNGESPGIPYVMEIWPPSHYSPVHNHGSANAIIRILHGSINVSLYPYLGANVEPFGVINFKKDDITWLSNSLNQVHKLTNINKETMLHNFMKDDNEEK